MAAYTSMTRILCRLQRAKIMIIQWLSRNQPPGMYGALAYDVPYSPESSCDSRPSQSVLESIMDNTLWAAVPKNRRSLERRLTRKHSLVKHFEAALPKKNIVACLDCGHWHERHTICGNCYKKVKEETKKLKAEMGDDFKYNTPWTEVSVVYEGEPKDQGKYAIEMKKPRPQWFPKHLTTSVKDDNS